MNIIFYMILFIIGIVVGGYWAIKSSEIPKELDMQKIYYSNKPNEELISKITYILIGGGSSVVLANILRVDFLKFDISNLIIYIFGMMYISTLVLIAGIDRNYLKIDKKLIAFGIIASIVYMIYLFMVELTSIYLSTIYFSIYMILLVIDSFLLRKYAKDSYIVNLLMLLAIMLVFTDLKTLTYTLVMAVIAIGLYTVLLKIQQKRNGNKKIKLKEIPIGYFVAASNVIVLFMIRIFENYCI